MTAILLAPLLLIGAAIGLASGAALIAWPVRDFGPANAPTLYARRITGAMIVGASLFLGGFTLAASNL